MKITITIEDDGDAVKVVSDPAFSDLMVGMMSVAPTAAVTYALGALNQIRDMSKMADKGLSAVKQATPLRLAEPVHTDDGAC